MNEGYLYELFRKVGLTDLQARTAEIPVRVAAVVVAAFVLSRIGSRLVRRSVQGLVARSSLRGDPTGRTATRAETLAGVAASLVRVAVWTVAALLMIDAVGINAGPVLAGASIVGVAVGFGAQSLVKDFLSGFFVLAEDQYGVGDSVTVLDVTGTVEDVNLRVTRLRAADGTVWYVPNGEIRKVGNSAKDYAVAIVDVTVPAGADVGAATAAIQDEVAGLGDEPPWDETLLEAPEVLGVEAMGTDGFTVRVSAKTPPGKRAAAARALRARIGGRLRADGLVPFREPAEIEPEPEPGPEPGGGAREGAAPAEPGPSG